MDRLRTLRIMGLSFFGLIAVLAVVLLVLSGEWEERDDDLARLGTIVSGVVGLLGLLVVLWWRGRATSGPVALPRLMNGFLLTVAFAEVGMLLGFVLAMGSRSMTPFWVGAGVFVLSLLVLLTALPNLDVEEPPPLT
jgi:hypothetical protein